ncbi:hypothetical protein K7B10_38105 [Streptomyces flavotricini]|uniref:Secreted protein n=1 Tax=Streptomyces flavotricini TaxID=66888 RepID=A0ABS8EHC2_9ACTN|nr:hypothetical protein [Streptomyces flavotricini]MCC0100486.1 hypothetical protein [Streptomyces flavotricini]
MMRAVLAATALALSLPTAAYAADQPAVVPQVLPMSVAVSALPLAVEDRTGYQRTSFKHWNAGDIPAGGCNTRAEVLLSEAVEYPQIGPGCALTGGVWCFGCRHHRAASSVLTPACFRYRVNCDPMKFWTRSSNSSASALWPRSRSVGPLAPGIGATS